MWDMTFKKLDAIMALVDLDNSGTIGFEEYLLTSVSPTDITAKAILQNAFKDFDIDGSRSLSIQEIRNRLQGGVDDKPVPESLWEGLFLLSKEEQMKS